MHAIQETSRNGFVSDWNSYDDDPVTDYDDNDNNDDDVGADENCDDDCDDGACVPNGLCLGGTRHRCMGQLGHAKPSDQIFTFGTYIVPYTMQHVHHTAVGHLLIAPCTIYTFFYPILQTALSLIHHAPYAPDICAPCDINTRLLCHLHLHTMHYMHQTSVRHRQNRQQTTLPLVTHHAPSAPDRQVVHIPTVATDLPQ